MSVSEIYSPITGSPLQIRIPDENASDVDKTARKCLSPPLSPTSARLSSVKQVWSIQLEEEYQEASRLIESHPEEARILFTKLIRDLPETAYYSLFLADCKLGLALTYPEDSKERIQTALEAKQDLDKVYERKNLWGWFGTTEKVILNHKGLRMSLRDLGFLAPKGMENLHADIALKIEECNRHIPLLTDFYDQIDQAVLMKGDQGKDLLTEALKEIEGHEEPEYLLARAFGTMHLALFDPDNYPLSHRALMQTLTAYERKKELFTDHEAKLTALNSFITLFNNLSQLFPVDSDIKVKLFECRKELAHLTDPAPKSTGTSPKVSKEPVDSWKTARLIIAFGFAAIVIASAFVLGRRYVSLSK